MQLLKIDLSSLATETQDIKQETIEKWLGGRGLGAYLYSQDVRKPNDPLNSVFIVSGAVTGSPLLSSSRSVVVSSSPLTGFYQASNFGGFFGAYLRSQNIMALQITGEAETPVWISIENGQVEFQGASDIWGKNTLEVQNALAPNRTYSTGCIGRGGENLARFACLKFDNRAAGRTGTGWHFGYKRLKAIVVKKALEANQTENRPAVMELAKDFTRKRLEYEQSGGFISHCTPPATNNSSNGQTYPASNYRRNHLNPEELNSIGYEAFQKKVAKKTACWSCPLACTRYVKTSYHPEEIRGPEYESIWALGASCDNFDLDAISQAAYLCDDYGLDTISTGATIAWYKECIEKGLIDDQPVTIERELELIKLIGDRKDVGDLLAEGSVHAAEKFPGTSPNLAHAKKLELPAWDPRGTWGGILHYATCSTGGDHCKGLTLWAELNNKATALSTDNKAAMVIMKQDQSAFRDSIGICMFTGDFLDNNSYIKAFEAVLDLKLPSNAPQIIGERIIQTERNINEQLGIGREDDSVPVRILNYPMVIRGQTVAIGEENFSKMLTEYYQLRGWE